MIGPQRPRGPQRSRAKTPLLALIGFLLLGTVMATGAVWTNTLGAGQRFDSLMDRIRLAVDPPPDRETLPTIEVTPPPRDATTAAADRVGVPATPRPKRKPVDFKLHFEPDRVFASQHTNDWCAPAGVQIVLAMHGLTDNSVPTQVKLAGRIDAWEAWRDSHNGGWGPAAIAQALAANGVAGYEVRAYGTRKLALRDAAAALKKTRSPVILIAWRGAHTWVMSGFRANADPTIFDNATVTGTYIYDPWFPRVSTIWGPSDGPGAFQDASEMERNYLRWRRPEGEYKERDGKFLAVVPTIHRRDQRAPTS